LSANYDVEWLFVDDGSSDRTADLLTEFLDGSVNGRLVRHENNRGISAAIRTGIEAANTELVASIDADGSYDPCELVHMLPLMEDDVALVTASPYHPAGAVRNVPAWRLALSWGASQAYRSVLRSRLYTFTSCFRVYRKSRVAPLPLAEDRFLGTAELVAQLVRRGERIVEHPATLSVRLFGCSKLKTTRTIIDHLRLLTRLSLAGKQPLSDSKPALATAPSSQ
jgi:glycosyltransferase involved in cell wall biosynthesis